MALRHRLRPYWLRLTGALRRERRVQVDGLDLLVPPGVLDPVLFGGGALLAEAVAARPPGSLLDLGCGSGIVAIRAARAGSPVAASDVHPPAVAAARENAARNGVTLEARCGDLFEPWEGRCFARIAFNPPFYEGIPRNDADRAWRGVGVLARFADAYRAHLVPGGEVLLLLSSRGAGAALLADLRARGDRLEILLERPFADEVYTVWRVTPAEIPGSSG